MDVEHTVAYCSKAKENGVSAITELKLRLCVFASGGGGGLDLDLHATVTQ